MKKVQINTTLLEMKLREKGIILNTVKRKSCPLTAHLTVSEKDRLEKLADYRHIRVNDLVNNIIKQYTIDWEDLKWYHGFNRPGFIESVKTFFAKPEDHLYVTFDVHPTQYERISTYKNKYEIIRGKIITRILSRYLASNRG